MWIVVIFLIIIGSSDTTPNKGIGQVTINTILHKGLYKDDSGIPPEMFY